MLFSSIIFIFYFLPFVLAGNRLLRGNKYRNLFLFLCSIFFFAFGEPENTIIFLVSILANYCLGLLIGSTEKANYRKLFLYLGIVFNLCLLGYYKYYNFIYHSFGSWIEVYFPFKNVLLPLGISFYTFHSISYIIDVYKKKVAAEPYFVNLALYISFFPQLIAGPIVRYVDIKSQLYFRKFNIDFFALGVKRFILGLAKKVLLANTFAEVADRIFKESPQHYYCFSSWLGIFLYTLQIYYDFSGYSDMAIGLGRMLGFNFKENFNFPYASQSIQEFWRRWHISLSGWFRDYLYIPLGGNRGARWHKYLNILIVFSVTGLWHGANSSYVIWGLMHGSLIVLEQTLLKAFINSRYVVLKNIYAFAGVLLLFIFFRIESFSGACSYLRSMFDFSGRNARFFNIYNYGDAWLLVMVVMGIIFCYPQNRTARGLVRLYRPGKLSGRRNFVKLTLAGMYVLLFLISIFSLSSGTYNPFIYFRF